MFHVHFALLRRKKPPTRLSFLSSTSLATETWVAGTRPATGPEQIATGLPAGGGRGTLPPAIVEPSRGVENAYRHRRPAGLRQGSHGGFPQPRRRGGGGLCRPRKAGRA